MMTIKEDPHILTWRFILRKYLEEENICGKKNSEEYNDLIYRAVENYFLDDLENNGYNIHIKAPGPGAANQIARRIENSERISNPSYAAEVFGWIKAFFNYVAKHLRWEYNPLDGVRPPREEVIYNRKKKR